MLSKLLSLWREKHQRLFERNQHILNHIGKNFNVIKRTLEDPYIIFESVDKNNIPCIDFVKCFKVKGKKILVIFSAIDPKTFNVSTIFEPDDPDEYVWEKYIKGRERRLYTRNASVSECYTSKIDGLDDTSLTFKAVNFCLPCFITENGTKSCVSAEKSLDGYGDFYTVRDMRKRSRKEPGDVATNKNLQFTKDNDRKINNFNRSMYELTNGVKSYYDMQKTLKIQVVGCELLSFLLTLQVYPFYVVRQECCELLSFLLTLQGHKQQSVCCRCFQSSCELLSFLLTLQGHKQLPKPFTLPIQCCELLSFLLTLQGHKQPRFYAD